MTNEEWQFCGNYVQMLKHVAQGGARKLRLFACACCRFARNHLRKTVAESLYRVRDPEAVQAIEVVERYVDRQASRSDVEQALAAVPTVDLGSARPTDPAIHVHAAIQDLGRKSANEAAYAAGHRVLSTIDWHYPDSYISFGSARNIKAFREKRRGEAVLARQKASKELAQLLRDIFYRSVRPVLLDEQWLNWNNGTLIAMAEEIYENRSFEQMGILGDALEDAGCEEASLIEHCRAPIEHVRGCWALDFLLKKQ